MGQMQKEKLRVHGGLPIYLLTNLEGYFSKKKTFSSQSIARSKAETILSNI